MYKPMIDHFDQFYTNRDLGDEQDHTDLEDIVIRDARNYYITLNADGSLNITKEKPNDTTS